LEAAQRELKEETGLIAQKWTKISHIHTSNSVTDEEGFVFLAQGLEQHATEPEETEILQLKKVHLSEALEMVISHQITDAISVIGIFQAAIFVGILKK
jgi:8-oxo-dGTP pyrophosphatase MutT (NUDIX family)